jgi:uncharacterized membrane protein YdjX (TVP38/TMEM64 family)
MCPDTKSIASTADPRDLATARRRISRTSDGRLMRRKHWLLAGLVLFAVTVYLFATRRLPLDTIVAYETQLRGLIARHVLWSCVMGLCIYTLLSFVPGTSGKAIVYGWLFGFWPALLQVNLAMTAAAIGSFFLSRYFLQDVVQSRFGFYVERFNRALSRNGGFYVATLRLLHVPYTFVNYGLGASSVRWTTFWWASQLGMLPGNIVFVLVGAHLPSLDTFARDGLRAVLSVELVTALVLMSCFPLVMQQFVRFWRRKRHIDERDLTS